MNTSTTPSVTLQRATDRGHADHGWLNTWHSFSFAGWQHPDHVHFGALRVLNDDTVAPGGGFGSHPHANMEIISLVTEGALEHKDSMGHEGVVRAGELQVISAGTGIRHSEFNPDPSAAVKFFQIWIFPRQQGTAPRYQQAAIVPGDLQNNFAPIVRPGPTNNGLWIGQDAWLHLGRLETGRRSTYAIKKAGNGVYALVVRGSAQLMGQQLNERDAAAMTGASQLEVIAGKNGAEVLLIEVPMIEHP